MILWTIPDIATEAGVSRQRVGMWTRRADFPAPFAQTGKGHRLWAPEAIREWLEGRK